MSLFDETGVVLIAVDDKFTLEDKDGIEVNKGSIHRQFLDKYYTEDSGHKEKIATTVAKRCDATEVAIPIDDKVFVLFAYSTQGSRDDYINKMSYRRGFIKVEGALKKVFAYCKEHFPDEVVHTALIGTGIQNDRTKSSNRTGYSVSEHESENLIHNHANEVGLSVKIIKVP